LIADIMIAVSLIYGGIYLNKHINEMYRPSDKTSKFLVNRENKERDITFKNKEKVLKIWSFLPEHQITKKHGTVFL